MICHLCFIALLTFFKGTHHCCTTEVYQCICLELLSNCFTNKFFVFIAHENKTFVPSPLQGCFIFSLVKYKPLTYNKVYMYPDWAIGIGWTLALASMICIPMVVVIKIIQSDGPLIEVGGAATLYLAVTLSHHVVLILRLVQVRNEIDAH